MPIYEYRRPDGTVFEVHQKLSDKALTKCPDTGVPVERIISRSSFQLKGGGWYTTDYAGAGKKDTSASEPPSENKTEQKKEPTESTDFKKELQTSPEKPGES